MTDAECTEDVFLKTIFATFFIIISILYLKTLFMKKFFNTKISKEEISEVLKLKDSLVSQLKDVAEKASTEGNLLSSELQDLDGLFLVRLQEKSSVLLSKMLAALDSDHASTSKRFEELENTVDSFRKESQGLKEGLEKVTFDKDLYETEMYKRLMEVSLQTGDDEDNGLTDGIEKYSLQASRNADVHKILLTMKQCMNELVSTSMLNWKNIALKTSTAIKYRCTNLEDEIKGIINENSKNSNHFQFEMINASASEGIEKQLLEIFIFLDRKFVDVQAIEKTLTFFNRKFINFADKCGTRWNQSCSNLDETQDSLFEAKGNLVFSSSKLSRISCCLTTLTSDMEELVKLVQDAVWKVDVISKTEAIRKSSTKKIERIFCVVDSMTDTLSQIEGNYLLNLEAISKTLKIPIQRIESFAQYVEDLEFFIDLVKNEKYENVTPASCHGDTVHFDQSREYDTLSSVSGDGMSSCQLGDSFSECSFDIDRSIRHMNERFGTLNSKESRKQLTLSRMMTILGEVLKKTAVELVEKDGGNMKGNCPLKTTIDENEKESFKPPIPADMPLRDISSDVLVQNSSSSSEEDDCATFQNN